MPSHIKKQKGKNFDLANNSELYHTATNPIVVCSHKIFSRSLKIYSGQNQTFSLSSGTFTRMDSPLSLSDIAEGPVSWLKLISNSFKSNCRTKVGIVPPASFLETFWPTQCK